MPAGFVQGDGGHLLAPAGDDAGEQAQAEGGGKEGAHAEAIGEEGVVANEDGLGGVLGIDVSGGEAAGFGGVGGGAGDTGDDAFGPGAAAGAEGEGQHARRLIPPAFVGIGIGGFGGIGGAALAAFVRRDVGRADDLGRDGDEVTVGLMLPEDVGDAEIEPMPAARRISRPMKRCIVETIPRGTTRVKVGIRIRQRSRMLGAVEHLLGVLTFTPPKSTHEIMVDQIREHLHRDLFQPFRIVTTSGHAYEVQSPHAMASAESYLFYCFPHSDRSAHAALNQIVAWNPRRRRP